MNEQGPFQVSIAFAGRNQEGLPPPEQHFQRDSSHLGHWPDWKTTLGAQVAGDWQKLRRQEQSSLFGSDPELLVHLVKSHL